MHLVPIPDCDLTLLKVIGPIEARVPDVCWQSRFDNSRSSIRASSSGHFQGANILPHVTTRRQEFQAVGCNPLVSCPLIYPEWIGAALIMVDEKVTEGQVEWYNRRIRPRWDVEYGMERVEYTGNRAGRNIQKMR